ncbi:MAG: FKBP-type peptidyl-prolyl cis-trans isomerase [Pseudomonadota bacterium]|nr:FKBP-type peptidyl-prolyl cis-trans isomerase [Pseudomonadota bacterium]
MRTQLPRWLPALALVFVGHLYAEPESDLKSDEEKLSYAVGLGLGSRLAVDFERIDMQALRLGIEDGMDGRDPRITEEEVQRLFTEWNATRAAKADATANAAATENRAAGDAYRDKFRGESGVKETASGLLYKVIDAGSGERPESGDQVKVHYRGQLVDGTEFDSSHRRGEPAVFPVDGLIPGWVEALKMMREGALWKVVIPPEIGYGSQGAGQAIGPDATLVFEMELLEINPGRD